MSLQRFHETASAATSDHSLPLEELVRLEPRTDDRAARTTEGRKVAGAVVGTLVGFDDAGRPLVVCGLSPDDTPLAARSTVPVAPTDAGREVVLMFELGDVSRPLVLGLLQPPRAADSSPGVTAQLDGERLVLTAEREIELKCGKASIVLTRAGKILLRGAYVSSRSSGVNRIKGGSVQIN
jgi:hypothetical protein